MMKGSILFAAFLMVVAPQPAVAAGPSISFIHKPPTTCRAGEPLVIEGHMLGASDVESVLVYYRTSRTHGWRSLELEIVQGDHYRAEIPADDVREPSLEYYVVAADFLETRTPAFGSEESPALVTVQPGAKTDADGVIVPKTNGSRKPGPEPGAPPLPAATEPSPTATAAREATLGDFASFGTVTTIEAAQIEAMAARTLLDIHLALPEVDISHDVSGFAHVALRGLGADGDVLLLVDDQVLNNAYDGRAFWDLPADMVRRVEVRRGPASGLATEGSLAGVIAVTTRTGESRKVTVSAGSDVSHLTDSGAKRRGSYSVTAHGGLRLSPLIVSGFASASVLDGSQATVRSDAYSSQAFTSQAPGPLMDQSLRVTAGSDVGLIGLLPGDLTAQARYAFERRGASVGLVDTYGPDSELSWHVGLLQLRHNLPLGERGSLKTRLALDMQETDRRYQLTPKGFTLSDRNGDGNPESFPDGVLEVIRVRTFGVVGDISADRHLGNEHTLSGGLLVSYRRAAEPHLERNIDGAGAAKDLSTIDSGPDVAPLTRTMVSAHIQDDWTVHPNVDVSLGVRFAYLSDLGGIELAKVLNPRLGLIYRPVDGLALKVLYGSTFRPPMFAERSDQSGATLPSALAEDRILGNPHLEATSAHTIEAGAEYHAVMDGLGYAGRLTGSYARIVDSIDRVPGATTTDPTSQLVLVSQSPRIDELSADFEGRVEFASRSYLYAGGWWLRLQDTESTLGTTLLTDKAQLGAVFGVNLEVGDLGDIHLMARYGAERRNDVRTVLERLRRYRLPAYVLVVAAARTRTFWDLARFGVSAHNLFDVDQRDPVPRPDLMPELLPNQGLQVLFTVEVIP